MNRMQRDLQRLGRQLWPDDAPLRPRAGAAAEDRFARSPLRVASAGLATALALAAAVVAGTIVLHRPSSARPISPQATGHAALVPWLDAPVPNVAKPYTKAGVGPCAMSSLSVVVKVADPSYIGAGPMNTSSWAVHVRDRSSKPCYVANGFAVTFRTASATLTLRRDTNLINFPDPTYLWPQSRKAPAGYQSEADGEIDSFPCALPPIATMVLSIPPGLGSMTLNPGPAGGWGAPCTRSRETYLSEFFGPDEAVYTIPLATATVSAAPNARAGERLRFFVRLTNTTAPHSCVGGAVVGCGAPNPQITFRSCPTYHLELEGVPDTLHTYRLNCGAARSLSSDQSETFEMYVDIPADAHPGPAVLAWSIDGDPQMFGPARAPVVVLPAT